MRTIIQADLNSFLRLGYFLRYRNPRYTVDFTGANLTRYREATREELIDLGKQKYLGAISRRYSSHGQHVIPLSGGLDSRGILGGLLEHTQARNIRTYTFGTPGSLDYDIGNMIARKVGTEHLAIPLTEHVYTVRELIEVAGRIDYQTCLFMHPDIQKIDTFCDGGRVWSGALIDVFFGRHEHKRKGCNWEEGKRNFMEENTSLVRGVKLSNCPDEVLFEDIETDPSTAGRMCFEHCLDLLNRQLKFIAPHVLMNGFQYDVLFEDRELTDFALSVDPAVHESQTLYKRILCGTFPKLFGLPTKGEAGLPLEASPFRRKLHRKMQSIRARIQRRFIGSVPVKPNINYIDFAHAIRAKKDFRELIWSLIADLRNRKLVPWIDFEGLWQQHFSGTVDLSGAFIVLASLEIHLKAGLELK